jgi:hypothetical protein
VESKSFLQTCLLLQELDVTGVGLILIGVVVLGLDVLVLGKVVVDGTIPRLWNIVLVGGIPFLLGPTVDTLTNYCPPQIVVRKLALENWSRSGESSEVGSESQELVMQVGGMVDVLRLVGDL